MAAPLVRLAPAGLLFALAVLVAACQKEADDPLPTPDATDRALADAARATTGFTWFGNSPALLPKSTGSAHVLPWLRVRYDALAAGQLDSASGRVRAGATFAEGSLIVKELHETATGGATHYAVMQKMPASPRAASDGWVWAEFNADGSVSVSSNAKGAGCTSCHSQPGNVDATLLTKFFP